MKMRNLSALAAIATFALMTTVGSVNRAEARRGWGWGIGAGIATALVLGAIYRHHRPNYGYRYYYGGYPSYGYGYPYYGYRYYSRPRWHVRHYRPRWHVRHYRRHRY